jgi:hypothetical protein
MEQNDGMNDQVREEIEGIMRRTGLTEAEARARYHLWEAREAFNEVKDTPVCEGAEPLGSIYGFTVIFPHFEALHNFLARRVLERERPEGWRRGVPEEEDQA